MNANSADAAQHFRQACRQQGAETSGCGRSAPRAPRPLYLRRVTGRRLAAAWLPPPFLRSRHPSFAALRTGFPCRSRTLPATIKMSASHPPMVFGFIPECRSAPSGISVRLRRNPQLDAATARIGRVRIFATAVC
jgi:hypothetical protein